MNTDLMKTSLRQFQSLNIGLTGYKFSLAGVVQGKTCPDKLHTWKNIPSLENTEISSSPEVCLKAQGKRKGEEKKRSENRSISRILHPVIQASNAKNEQ